VENYVQPDRPQKTLWRLRIARWIPKATNTYSVYVIRIAFPLQQWLQERASVSPYLTGKGKGSPVTGPGGSMG